MKVWEGQTGRLVADCLGHRSPVWSVALSPDGRWVASASQDRTVKVWEAQTGQLVADCLGHRRSVVSVAFSPDGRWLASWSDDRTVKAWEVQTGQCINTLFFDRRLAAVSFAAAEPRRLMVADDSGRIFGYEVMGV